MSQLTYLEGVDTAFNLNKEFCRLQAVCHQIVDKPDGIDVCFQALYHRVQQPWHRCNGDANPLTPNSCARSIGVGCCLRDCAKR
eukprot:965445-Rhodomonas_salina.2